MTTPNTQPPSVREALIEIANQDDLEMALDPQWAKRIARAALAAQAVEVEPIDMVLLCPACGLQHIDHEELTVEHDHGVVEFPAWNNPPHRSHLCHGCGHIWRPADVATNGVAAVMTKGKADSPLVAPQAAEPSAPHELTTTEANALDRALKRSVKFVDSVEPSVKSKAESGDAEPDLHVLMDRNAWRAAMIGLCVAGRESEVSTPELAAAHLRKRLAARWPEPSVTERK